MSFDFKLIYVFLLSTMVLFAVGHKVSIHTLIGIVLGLLCIMVALSVRHRAQHDWHWPGVGARGVLRSIVTILLGLAFLGSATTVVSPLNPSFFPWFAFGSGIILFGVLSALNVVLEAESEFQMHCGGQIPKQFESVRRRSEPSWKRLARGIFSLFFLLVWLGGVGFFWQFGSAYSHGSPDPTHERTEALSHRRDIVYITPAEKRRVSMLQLVTVLGIPSVILLGVLLQFVAGVNLSSDGGRPPE